MRRHSLEDWVLATRPWSFPASAMPVLVAMMWLWVEGLMDSWLLGLLALVNIVLVHAAGNVWSDYFDYRRGVDAEDTHGSMTLVSGEFEPREVLWFSIGLQVAAVAMGLTMVWLTGLTLLWIGMAGIALSLLYPPLKYAALGDVVIMVCYAMLPMLGVTFICSGEINPQVLWLAVPVGCITVAILHANNIRDIETDKRAGIRTFAMLTGRDFAIGLYVFELLLPYCWVPFIISMGVVTPFTYSVFASLPLALFNIHSILMYSSDVMFMERVDELTAMLQLLFSTTLILGLLCDPML